MSERRKARTATAFVGKAEDGIPREVGDQLDPLWSDYRALRAHPVFRPYADSMVRGRLRMGGRVYHHIVARWALDHGFESTEFPKSPDWRKVRALGERS